MERLQISRKERTLYIIIFIIIILLCILAGILVEPKHTLMAIVALSGSAGIIFIGANLYGNKRWLAILVLLITITTVVFCYAKLYNLAGLYHGKECLQNPNVMQCLYFSVVTWTMLGYGDFHPNEGLSQFLAASEAIMGYVYMGLLIVSIAASRRST